MSKVVKQLRMTGGFPVNTKVVDRTNKPRAKDVMPDTIDQDP